ncbi:MAG: NAD-dependent epimerase/dehydratase family protein [Nitrososphaerales archaeon]
MRVLVTGGAGFIGSHLVDALMERGEEVAVLDNLSRGRVENVAKWFGHERFKFMRGDLLHPSDIRLAMDGCEVVFHLAANPEVRLGALDTRVDYEQNVLATYNLLEAVREFGVGVVFASTSTVYGEADVIPTPENYGPLKPISLYGASKLACEALISGYAHMFGLNSVILRLANVVGPRCAHGVIYDFVMKLRSNPNVLEVLGDGTQRKSYLYVDDVVDAFLLASRNLQQDRLQVYNVGSEDQVDVLSIAKIVVDEMGLKDVAFRCAGGLEGRGWVGDVKEMLLDVSKIKKMGWRPRSRSVEAVKLAVREFLRSTQTV